MQEDPLQIKRLVKIVTVHQGKLILVKQFRKTLNQYTYELPGGKLNENKEKQLGAIR